MAPSATIQKNEAKGTVPQRCTHNQLAYTLVMELNPRWILAFRAIAEAGSISGGARTLGLTQPTATVHLDALESTLGVRLLTRQHTGVTLTEAGSAILSHADVIADHLDAIADQASRLRSHRLEAVRVAAFTAAIGTFLPGAWARLRASNADIDLALAPANPADALALLDRDETDVAIVFQHEGDPHAVDLSDYTSVPLADYEMRLVLPAGHRLATVERLTLPELMDEDWVIGFSTCHDHFVDLCHEAGFEPRIRHESDDFTVTQEMVAEGLAVSALTRCCLTMHANPGTVTRPLPELSSHRVYAVCRPGVERRPPVRALLKALLADDGAMKPSPRLTPPPAAPSPRRPAR